MCEHLYGMCACVYVRHTVCTSGVQCAVHSLIGLALQGGHHVLMHDIVALCLELELVCGCECECVSV
jgi:hypothetical protein